MATFTVPSHFNPALIVPGLINPDTLAVWVDTPIPPVPATQIDSVTFGTATPLLVLPDPTLNPGDTGYIADVTSVLTLWFMLAVANGASPGAPNTVLFPLGMVVSLPLTATVDAQTYTLSNGHTFTASGAVGAQTLTIISAGTCVLGDVGLTVAGPGVPAGATLTAYSKPTFYRVENGLQIGAPLSANGLSRVPSVSGRHPEVPKASTGIDWFARNLVVDFQGGGLCYSDLTTYHAGNKTGRTVNGGILAAGDATVEVNSVTTPSNGSLPGGLLGAPITGPGIPAGQVVTGVGGMVVQMTQPAFKNGTQIAPVTLVAPAGILPPIQVTGGSGSHFVIADRLIGKPKLLGGVLTQEVQHPDGFQVGTGQVLQAASIAGRLIVSPCTGPTAFACTTFATAKIAAGTGNVLADILTPQTFTLANGHTFTATALVASNILTIIAPGTLALDDAGQTITGYPAGALPSNSHLGVIAKGPATTLTVVSAKLSTPALGAFYGTFTLANGKSFIGRVGSTGVPVVGLPPGLGYISIMSVGQLTMSDLGQTITGYPAGALTPGTTLTALGLPLSATVSAAVTGQRFTTPLVGGTGHVCTGMTLAATNVLLVTTVGTLDDTDVASNIGAIGVAPLTRVTAVAGDLSTVTVSPAATDTVTGQTFALSNGHTFIASATAGSATLTVTTAQSLAVGDGIANVTVLGAGLIGDAYVHPVTAKAIARQAPITFGPGAATASAVNGSYVITSVAATAPRRQNGLHLLSLGRTDQCLIRNGHLLGALSTPNGSTIAGQPIRFDALRYNWQNLVYFAASNTIVDNVDNYGAVADLVYTNYVADAAVPGLAGRYHVKACKLRNSIFSGCGRQGWTINDADDFEVYNNDISHVSRFIIDSEPTSSSAAFRDVHFHDITSTGGGVGFMHAAHPHSMILGNFILERWTLRSGHYICSLGILGTPATPPVGWQWLNNVAAHVVGREYANSKTPMMRLSGWDTVTYTGNVDWGNAGYGPSALDLSKCTNVTRSPNSFVGFSDSEVSYPVGFPRARRFKILDSVLDSTGWQAGLLLTLPPWDCAPRSASRPDGYVEVFGDTYARVTIGYPPRQWQGAAGNPPAKSGPSKVPGTFAFPTIGANPAAWAGVVAVGLWHNGTLELWGEILDSGNNPDIRYFNTGEAPSFVFPTQQINAELFNQLRVLL